MKGYMAPSNGTDKCHIQFCGQTPVLYDSGYIYDEDTAYCYVQYVTRHIPLCPGSVRG